MSVAGGLMALVAAAAARLAAAGIEIADEPLPEGAAVWRLELESASAGPGEGEGRAVLAVIHETEAYRGLSAGLAALAAAAAALDRRRLTAGRLLAVPLWRAAEFGRDPLTGRRLAVLRFNLMIQEE